MPRIVKNTFFDNSCPVCGYIDPKICTDGDDCTTCTAWSARITNTISSVSVSHLPPDRRRSDTKISKNSVFMSISCGLLLSFLTGCASVERPYINPLRPHVTHIYSMY